MGDKVTIFYFHSAIGAFDIAANPELLAMRWQQRRPAELFKEHFWSGNSARFCVVGMDWHNHGPQSTWLKFVIRQQYGERALTVVQAFWSVVQEDRNSVCHSSLHRKECSAIYQTKFIGEGQKVDPCEWYSTFFLKLSK